MARWTSQIAEVVRRGTHAAVTPASEQDATGERPSADKSLRDGLRLNDESATLIRKLAAHVPGLVFKLRMDSTGRIEYLYVSESTLQLYELNPTDVLRDASLVNGRIHPDDLAAVQEALRRSAVDLNVLRQTYRVVLPIRGERLLSVCATPERARQGSIVWHGIVTDVTEEQHRADRLNALTLRCEGAVKAAEQHSAVIARVSHELRTPLNAIIGFAELIRSNPDADPRETAQSAHQIRRAGKHLLSLINDLLDIASIETNGLRGSLRPLHVPNLVQDCVALMTPYATQRHVALTASVASSLPAVTAEPRAIKQILFNLIGNAVKFSGTDSLVRIDAYLDPSSRWIVVAVEDQGPGIPPDALEKLFKPFFRVSGERLKKEGTGLGLAISQRLAVAMGGAIHVSSCVGQGTVFSLRVPVSTEPAQPLDESEFGDIDVEWQKVALEGNILYVEDEPVSALLMKQFCSLHPGIRLTVVESGADAIRVVRDLRPDLVLLDINLPDMHGQEVLSALRSNPSIVRTPIVALSGDAMMSREHPPGQAGFDAYWLKPVDQKQLELGLAKLLSARPGSVSGPQVLTSH